MLFRKLFPFIVAVLGFCFVLALSLALQDGTPPKKEEGRSPAVSFSVKPPPPPPKSKPKPKPKPKPKAAPPPPQLAIASTGLQFGLEGLQFDNTAARNFSSGGKGQEDVVMTLATIDVPPKPLQRSAAAYPSRARRSGIEGHVTLSMLISREGDVQDVMVVRAKPSGIFEQSAMESIRKWRFAPGQYEGKNVAVRVSQTVHFRLGS